MSFSSKMHRHSSKLKTWLTNPWLNRISVLAGLVSIPLSIILFVMGLGSRDLRINVNSVPIVVVNSASFPKVITNPKTASDLIVTYGGKEITTDVTAVQVAVWNAGKLPIKAEHVLQSLTIMTEDGSPIIEASIVKVIRDISGVILDKREADHGKLRATWTILEQGDGVVFQVMYAGSPGLVIKGTCIIEGQKAISTSAGTMADQRRDWASALQHLLSPFVVLFSGLTFCVTGMFMVRRWKYYVGIIFAIFGAVMLIGGVILLRNPLSPFGF